MKKNRIAASALALSLCLALAACSGGGAESPAPESTAPAGTAPVETTPAETASAESDLAYVRDKGTLVVGITEFEPMDYQDADGNWIGFDADMAKAFAESLGVEAQFQVIEWDNKVMELDGKTIDVVWNGMTLTDEVTSAMSCTNAYCNNAQIVILPADVAADYPDVESMSGLNFAVESGSAG